MQILPTIDLLIIGAGPAGSVAAGLARKHGYSVRVLEKQVFPRFSIGESLLPHLMDILDEAGMLAAVQAADFQYKNGAQIVRRGETVNFEFSDKSSHGWSHTYQVARAEFDDLLAHEAARLGAEVIHQEEILAADFNGVMPMLTSGTAAGETRQHHARFVLDASGFGRVLPRLLKLDRPSNFPTRASIFTHVEHGISDADFDPHKIRVSVHPSNKNIWFWLIPLSATRASVGVVAEQSMLDGYPGTLDEKLWALVNQEADMGRLLRNRTPLWPARQIIGYAASVTTLHGPNWALLGNAGEFLDPVFSSGVTIAMKSASLAVAAMHRQLSGETVDWQTDYAQRLMLGVETFRGFVETWYEGDLPDVMLAPNPPDELRKRICSVLAGYAWDKDNPYVPDSGRRLRLLAKNVRSLRPTVADAIV